MWRPPAKLHGEAFTPSRRGHHALNTCSLVGGIDFVLGRLEELGVSARRQRRWAERHRRRFVRIAEARGPELADLVSSALVENVEEFERCLAAIKPDQGAFPYGPAYGHQFGHWEFEDDIFGARETVEDARSPLGHLGLATEVDANLARFRSHDETLRKIIPFAVSEMVKFEGTVRPAGLFPREFWWRLLAWEEFQRPENQAVLMERARELYGEMIREGL